MKTMNFFTLESRGRKKEDIFDDPAHFYFFLYIYETEADKISFPVNMCRLLFDCSNIKNITKSNEYQKILRYANRLRKSKLVDFKKDKKSVGQRTYYSINWNGVISAMIDIIKKLPKYHDVYMLKHVKYNDNKYITAFVKLYFRGIVSFPTFRYKLTPISFKEALLLLCNRIISKIDEDELYEYQDFQKKKKNKEAEYFINFIAMLKEFDKVYRPHSAVDGFSTYLIQYLNFKGDKEKTYNELLKGFMKDSDGKEFAEEVLNSWYGSIINLEDDLKKIDKFHFPD